MYAEAYVTVHQYDIVMDVTVINRSSETLQNLCLELATMGDLKLVERPQNYTLAPGATKVIRANIKVGALCWGLGLGLGLGTQGRHVTWHLHRVRLCAVCHSMKGVMLRGCASGECRGSASLLGRIGRVQPPPAATLIRC